jgi:putative ABC transport system permease protein
MKEGRYFSDTRASDTTQAVVVNEAFIDYFKIENPLEGKFKLFGQQEFSHIIGVVKNFHTEGLQNKIYPLFIINRPNWQHGYVNFKIAPTSVPQTISAIQEKWKGIEPLHPFRYSFLDDDFAMEYAEQTRFGQTIFYATLLAILIAALGLFGLSSYMAEQRTKEIGVRKVLGASMVNLINLLIKDFIKLVLIAGLLAIPVSYWLVNKWLEDFAYRTDINILPFIIAIFSALLLAIVTVSYQSLKVSAANPIKALKTE